ncbi:MAG: hypothetical protein HY847_19740 [Betaproteobacteria bacterium]|nr:hypothetical protein [Betaproteobacteria bacterium]
MPNSIREQVLQAVMGILMPIATAEGAQVFRSPPTGITREQSPALLLFPESDGVTHRPNGLVERSLVIRLVALARETGNESPETIADHLLVAAHAALFSHTTLGGLCLGIKELECEWDIEDADATAAAIPARYQITYRTLANDISQQG